MLQLKQRKLLEIQFMAWITMKFWLSSQKYVHEYVLNINAINLRCKVYALIYALLHCMFLKNNVQYI